MSTFTCRPYQQEALRRSVEAFRNGINRQLIHLPTGTGKTVIFSKLKQAHEIKKRMLVLAHREELIEQACTKLSAETGLPIDREGKLSIGVEKANDRSRQGNPIVVAGVQTLAYNHGARLKSGRFNPSDFGLIICDEAHHSTAKSYRAIFDHFRLFEPENECLLVGVTATPKRADGVGLGNIYKEIVFTKGLLSCIEEGWLSDIRAFRVKTTISLDSVKSIGPDDGDRELDDVTLSKAINIKARNELIVRRWKELADCRQTLVFCATIAHAQELANEFRNAGINSEAVWGDDPDRRAKVEKHQKGDIRVLTNCNVLTEGYDDWRISCVVLARPTLSATFFAQMIGRGTRIQKDIDNLVSARQSSQPIQKQDCIVIDVVDNTRVHKLISVASLIGLGAAIDFHGRSVVRTAREQLQRLAPQLINLPANLTIDELLEEVDLFTSQWSDDVLASSRLRWVRKGDGWTCPLLDDQNISLHAAEYGWTVCGRISDETIGPSNFPDREEAVRFVERLLRFLDKSGLLNLASEDEHCDPLLASPLQCKLIRERVPDYDVSGLSNERAEELISRTYGDLGSIESMQVIGSPAQIVPWSSELLRQPILSWIKAEGTAFEVPLPDYGYLRLEGKEDGWLASGECDGEPISAKHFGSQLDAVSYLEQELAPHSSRLFQMLKVETHWSETRPSPLAEALLKNLFDYQPEPMSRCEAESRVKQLYRRELNPFAD